MNLTRPRKPGSPATPVDGGRVLIGESMPIRKLKLAIAKISQADLPVMLTGETGTGKELVARMLHDQSSRACGPFVAVNCPAVPPDLFQAEVFGYEKGAFTGADRHNDGRIDAARGGTLFLDEIGDLPMDMQAVLLRFLQEGTFERLGSVKLIQADVRILAATHIDLKKAVAAGRFREDLFYRLNALHLHVPPLRDRGSDKILLAQHFVEECSAKLGLSPHTLSADARQRVMEHDWPGNVRELRNRILQALVLCENREITAGDLDLGIEPEAGSGDEESLPTLKACRHAAERKAIQNALQASGGCIETAALHLAISRAQLYRLIKTHQLPTG
ncbi:MAG: sigma-54 dependent transcriptional regulator [Wenzhouxiangellaceae bacterium]|nr:sigma-54 dependent transcriptional regulator [Wenzhouxiangellaceae bacterium]